ncbi:flagellar basal-body MS-ring/collar protein FliF [Dyella sedimenti]|uniref:flagellar basal-body MS-ring/collar protein FliF n=1 Tax=Dyella sedimenti TaxID=2919947 RepID=UPI001FA98B82|nr:flagellar basal-body MS-ring/collar protein FliF [Dyella sedimenti]
MQQFLSNLSRRARMGFALGAFLIVGAGASIAWWAAHPDYGVLFRDLKDADAAEITSALGQMQVPYRLADEGHAILVPETQVYDTRMKLVSQGVPKGGSVGFELFKDSDYGVTEFAQRVNFQRALQGELERTIDSMDEVSSSRVHLTIRRQDLFSHDEDASKASVAIAIKAGKHLDARQVVGIQRLLASAVEGLAPDAVVVLDGNGTVLSAHGVDGGHLAMGDRLDEQSRLELQLRRKVAELLHRVLSNDDFTVSVDVRLNYDHVKQVREQLISQGKDGNGLLVREKTGSSGKAADDADPDHEKPGSSSSEREVEYAHGREQEEIVQAPGRVERISVGIVVPEAMPQGAVAKLAEVVSAGLGLDATRGDKVDIASIAPPMAAPAGKPHATVPPPAAIPAPDVEDNHAAKEPRIAASSFPSWLWISVALGLCALLLVSSWGLWRARSAPKRLTLHEREVALQRLREWIAQAEAKP